MSLLDCLLRIGNISTAVEGTEEFISAIDSVLTVEVPDARYTEEYEQGTWDGLCRFYSRYSGRFPTGLLDRVTAELKDQGLPFKLIDERPPPHAIATHLNVPKRGLVRLYDYQIEAVRLSLLKQRGVLELATNAGKTVIAASIIKTLRNVLTPKPRVLFVVNTKDTLGQTIDVLDSSLSSKGQPFRCGQFGDGLRQIREVTVGLPPSLIKAARSIKGRKHLEAFDVLFIDECHHESSDTWYEIAMACSRATYRFGMSGTAFLKRNDKDYRLIAATGELICKVKNEQLIEQGVSARPIVTMLRARANPQTDYSLADFARAYRWGVARNPSRNRQISKLATILSSKGLSTFILTVHKVQGLDLYNRLSSHLDNVYYNHGSLPTQIRQNNLSKFRNNSGSIMIATTIYDEGVDVPEIGALILAGAGKSEVKTIQRVGRALRRKASGPNVTYVYDFVDDGNKYLLRHSRARYRTYLDENFEVINNKAKQWLESKEQPVTGIQRQLKARLLKRSGRLILSRSAAFERRGTRGGTS